MKIGTHSLSFQADDVFAVAMLQLHSPDASIEVVRTRDEAILATCDVVVDVGGVYDPALGRYDHHQRGRAGQRPNGVLYSACGLIWKHFGEAICSLEYPSLDREALARRVDERIVQVIDATDNGQPLFEGGVPLFPGLQQMSVSALIASLNPSWMTASAQTFDEGFHFAVGIATVFLRAAIRSEAGVLLGQDSVRQQLAKRTDPRVLVLSHYLPWQEVVCQDPDVLFVVFCDEGGTWMVQCVPPKPGSFEKRLALPERWAGLRDDEFAKEVGIPGVIFCHPGRFICGARSKESALRLVEEALR